MDRDTGTVILTNKNWGHKIDIANFFIEAHGEAHRLSDFDKYKLGLPNVRHTATK